MNIWRLVTQAGVHERMPLHLQDRLRFANRLGLVVAVTGVFLIGVYLYLGRNSMQALIGMTVFGALVPFFNQIGAHMVVRILLSFAPALTVTIFDISLKMNAPEKLEIISYITPRYVALGSIMLPLTLFTYQERWIRNTLVGLLLVLVFNFDYLFHLTGVHFTQIRPDLVSNAYNLQWINMLIVGATLLTSTSFLIYTNRKSEQNNQRILAETLSTNLRLQESENKLKESIEAIQESKRALEHNNYISTGLAHFLQLLRREKDFDKLATSLLSQLAIYLKVQQGAFYWLSGEELELKALYALPHQKATQTHFLPTEGLIGACFQQKHILHITDITAHQTQVLSGLGEGKARELIFAPLLADEKAVGVIELATFYHFAPYQIELLAQVAEASAASLANLQFLGSVAGAGKEV